MKKVIIAFVFVLCLMPIFSVSPASASLLDIENGFLTNVTLDVGAYYNLRSAQIMAGMSTEILSWKALSFRAGYTGTTTQDVWLGSLNIDLSKAASLCHITYVLSLLNIYPCFWIGRDFTGKTWQYGIGITIIQIGSAGQTIK